MRTEDTQHHLKTAEEIAAELAMAPDAAARDAERREQAEQGDDVLRAEDLTFLTRNVSVEEQAVVIAVLASVREEETNRVRRVESLRREPWARSQRTPEGIGDLLSG